METQVQTKEQIAIWMQKVVEDFDFDQFYSANGRDGTSMPLKFPTTSKNT